VTDLHFLSCPRQSTDKLGFRFLASFPRRISFRNVLARDINVMSAAPESFNVDTQNACTWDPDGAGARPAVIRRPSWRFRACISAQRTGRFWRRRSSKLAND